MPRTTTVTDKDNQAPQRAARKAAESDNTPVKVGGAQGAPQAAVKKAAARVRKEYQPLAFDAISVAPATDPEVMRKHRNIKNERSGEQMQVDSLVRTAYERWVSLGRPSDWNKSTSGYIIKLPEGQVETLVFLLRKAATYFDLALRLGKQIKEEDGRIAVLFFVKDKPEPGSDEEGAVKTDDDESNDS